MRQQGIDKFLTEQGWDRFCGTLIWAPDPYSPIRFCADTNVLIDNKGRFTKLDVFFKDFLHPTEQEYEVFKMVTGIELPWEVNLKS